MRRSARGGGCAERQVRCGDRLGRHGSLSDLVSSFRASESWEEELMGGCSVTTSVTLAESR